MIIAEEKKYSQQIFLKDFRKSFNKTCSIALIDHTMKEIFMYERIEEMKSKIIALVSLIAVQVPFSIPTYAGEGTMKINGSRHLTHSYLSYNDYSKLLEILEKRAKVQMMTKEEHEKELSRLPKFGYLYINLYTSKPYKPEYLIMAIVKDGEVIVKKKGDEIRASAEYGSDGFYLSGIYMLEQDIKAPFEVHIINALTDEKDVYKILGGGNAK